MRTRITTLALSGLTSAALVWGAGSAAYATPSIDHHTAGAPAAAQGEWVDGLLRLAAEGNGGTTAQGSNFGGRDSLASKLVFRQSYGTDGAKAPTAGAPAAVAQAPEAQAPVAQAPAAAKAPAAVQAPAAAQAPGGGGHAPAARPAAPPPAPPAPGAPRGGGGVRWGEGENEPVGA
ncbi:hypothetical protein ACFRAR_37225, partial [Kitasatospora sp. NPDC056651]